MRRREKSLGMSKMSLGPHVSTPISLLFLSGDGNSELYRRVRLAGIQQLAWTGTRLIRLARRMASSSRIRSIAVGRNPGKPHLLPVLPLTPAEATTLTCFLHDGRGGNHGASSGKEEAMSSGGIWVRSYAALHCVRV
jgi:hypothetical protein